MIFLTKIKDSDKSVTVAINAESYTEAETKSLRICQVICRAFSEVESIVKTGFKEAVLNEEYSNENTLFYKSKVAYNTETNSGKTKTVKVPLLVRACDADQAFELIKEYAEGFLDSARVFGMEETEVLDYYDHEKYKEIDTKDFKELVKSGKVKFSFKVSDTVEEYLEEDEDEIVEHPFI